MRVLYLTTILSISAALAVPRSKERIVGGSPTTINDYPFTAALLYAVSSQTYYQACAGTIITTTAVLSAAHCFYGDSYTKWRVRVGSTYANSGGIVHSLRTIHLHSNYNPYIQDNDVAVLRTISSIVFTTTVQAAAVAGTMYNLEDNQVVWAIGWGTTVAGGSTSEQLRQVQIWTINQSLCQNRYSELGLSVSENMVCSGWLDVGGRDQCQGDSGGPLIHNHVIVGICSWGYQCAMPRYPGVNTRVSRFTGWILSAAA